MLIFNTTFHVEDDIQEAYLEYMRQTYIPVATNSGFLHMSCFAHIYPQHEEQGTSYSLQLRAKNTDTFNYWMKTEGEKLQRELASKFGNKVLGFVTLLEEIDY
ncbi:DUF4286 family protein [Viscerimonas tarda]